MKYLAVLFFLSTTAACAAEAEHNYRPPEGYVPTAAMAAEIAAIIASHVYGAEQVNNQRPFVVDRKDGTTWRVRGVKRDSLVSGGVLIVEIDQMSGRIMRMSHGK